MSALTRLWSLPASALRLTLTSSRKHLHIPSNGQSVPLPSIWQVPDRHVVLQVIHGIELHQSFTIVVSDPNSIISHDTFILHFVISYLGIDVPHDDKEVVP